MRSLLRRGLVVLALTAASCRHGAPAVGSSAEPLHDLAFLSGTWVGSDGTEEHWSRPRGATMLGTGRTIEGGKTTFFEFMRIEARADGVVLVAQPRGGTPTEFRRVALVAQRHVEFENPTHDWPTHLVYSLERGGLRIRVEGPPGTHVDEVVLQREAAP